MERLENRILKEELSIDLPVAYSLINIEAGD